VRGGEKTPGRDELWSTAVKHHQWQWPLLWPLLAYRRGEWGGEEEGGSAPGRERAGEGEGAPASALADRRTVVEDEASVAARPSMPTRM
jgi:hypothetical protein